MQGYVANLLGASAARRMGPPGTIAAARTFLRQLNLGEFSNPKTFAPTLEAATLSLKAELPRGGQHWGSSRKFLNLFLRDATYNYHLRNTFDLDRIESELELPLDSFSAQGLIEESIDLQLSRWRGVIHLQPSESNAYQQAASAIAADKKPPVSRAHLDLVYWRRSKAKKST